MSDFIKNAQSRNFQLLRNFLSLVWRATPWLHDFRQQMNFEVNKGDYKLDSSREQAAYPALHHSGSIQTGLS